jgi:hypothetical protein
MRKNILKGSIIVGIVMLFLSTACLPVLASDRKPDLIVESIGFVPHGDGPFPPQIAAAEIKNVGDATAFGTIYLKYTFTRKFFGTIAQIDTIPMFQGGLEPGRTVDYFLIYEYELPKFGFFQFKCTVNPGRTIEESNYSNNDLAQNYLAFFGNWKQK